jgi:hypothetical protein
VDSHLDNGHAPVRSGYVRMVEEPPQQRSPLENLAEVMAKHGKKGVAYLLTPEGKHAGIAGGYTSRLPGAVEEQDADEWDKQNKIGRVLDGQIEWFREES